jgi:hypothetical protein
MAKRYEKITVEGEGSRKTTRLFQILGETPEFIICREVDLEGTDKDYYDKKDVLIKTVHMIDQSAVKRRVPMDLTYGELREKNKTYEDLEAGDIVVCKKDLVMNEITDPEDPSYQKAFTEKQEYTIISTHRFEDGVKSVTMINNQGEEHSMDDEIYIPPETSCDFSNHFWIK